MPTQSETLPAHAGLDETRSAIGPTGTLFDCIWRVRQTPDDLRKTAVASQLDMALSDFLTCLFALDKAMLERAHLNVMSRVGCAISGAALSCQTSGGRARWLRLRLTLDMSWDAILAGDVQPSAEDVGHELRARGVDFSFD